MFHLININNNIIFSQELITTIVINAITVISFFIILFFICINILKKFSFFKNFNFKKKISIQIFSGLIFGFISPLLLSISNIIDSQYFNFSQIFALITYSLLTSSLSVIGILPVFIISNFLLMDNIDNFYLLFITLFYSFAILFVFFNRFFLLKKVKNIILSSIVLIIALIILIGIFYNYNHAAFLNNFINLIVNWVIFFLLYAIAQRIINLIDNTYNLRTSIKYSDEKFVNSNFANKAFLEYIKKNKIETGLITTLSINGIEQIQTSEGNEFAHNVEKKFVDYLIYKFGKSTFYFKTYSNKYAFFIPLNKNKIDLKKAITNNYNIQRDPDDFLSFYSKILKNSLVGIDVNNKKYRLTPIGYCSLYGIQSNSFEELIDMMNNFEKKIISDRNINILQMAHPFISDEIDKKYDLSIINEKINLNDITIKLNEVFILEKNKTNKFLFPNISSVSDNVFNYKKVYAILNNDINLITIFLRKIAWRTLVLFSQYQQQNINNKYKLIINYPIYEISKKNFSDIQLIKKIQANNIDLNKIIFNFNLDSIDSLSNETINNLNALKKNNIKIAFEEIDEKNLNIIKQFKPNYVCIWNKMNNNKKSSITHTKKITNFFISQNVYIIFKN